MALTPPFATETDLPSTLSADRRARAAAQLGNASQLILDEDTHGVLDSLDEVTSTLQRITIAVAIRAALPGALAGDDVPLTQTQWGAGGFNESKTFANPMGDLYLTKAERRQLRFTKQRAGAVDMWAGAYETEA